MKMVEIKCPSCGGKLKVEDSQTKLITCEYCGSQFLLDDEKVQHITNYTIYQTTPSGKDQGNGAKIALGAGLACAGVLLAAFILSSGSGSSSGPRTAPPSIPAYTRPAGYLGKEGEAGEEVREGETAPKADSPLFHAMTWRCSKGTSESATWCCLRRRLHVPCQLLLLTFSFLLVRARQQLLCQLWFQSQI